MNTEFNRHIHIRNFIKQTFRERYFNSHRFSHFHVYTASEVILSKSYLAINNKFYKSYIKENVTELLVVGLNRKR